MKVPRNGARYGLGKHVRADYRCVDTGGAGIATCQGTVTIGRPIDMRLGTHHFRVTASDKDGNRAEPARATYTVFDPSTPDTKNPSVTIKQPASKSYATDADIRAAFNCDDDRGEPTCTASVKGDGVDHNVTSGDSLPNDPGTYTLTVVARDTAGNMRSDSRTYEVARPLPTLTLNVSGGRGSSVTASVNRKVVRTCSSSCTITVPLKTLVVLRPSPPWYARDPQTENLTWNGCEPAGASECSVTVSKDQPVSVVLYEGPV